MSNKRNKQEEHENHDRWLVSYADFITLLFAFFVVMYATSTNNQDKQKSFEKSVRMNLNLVGGASGNTGGGGGEGLVGAGGDTIDTVIQLEGFPKGTGAGEANDYVNRFVDQKMDASTKEAIQNIRHDAIGVRISLASAQFFNPGGTKLKVSSLKALDQIAGLLLQSGKNITIEGHTDNTSVGKNSPYETNWELGALRATSIVRYLLKYHQFEPHRLAAISYADTRPIKPNDTEENRAQNRRVEIYIVMDSKDTE
jgi:chemotaxis protein MotB